MPACVRAGPGISSPESRLGPLREAWYRARGQLAGGGQVPHRRGRYRTGRQRSRRQDGWGPGWPAILGSRRTCSARNPRFSPARLLVKYYRDRRPISTIARGPAVAQARGTARSSRERLDLPCRPAPRASTQGHQGLSCWVMSIVAVSPHLDDAALSASAALGEGDATIVTVFTALPAPDRPASWWDRLTSATSSLERQRERLAEDAEAARLLTPRALHLDEPDALHRAGDPDLGRPLGPRTQAAARPRPILPPS